jgi:hypothetical protein
MSLRKAKNISLEAYDVFVANHERRVERATKLLRAAIAARDDAYEREHPQCVSTKMFTSHGAWGSPTQSHRCELREGHAGRHTDTKGKRSWR